MARPVDRCERVCLRTDVYGIGGDNCHGVATNELTGIDFKARKIAAGDVDAQAMADVEQIGRRRQSDVNSVDPPRFQ